MPTTAAKRNFSALIAPNQFGNSPAPRQEQMIVSGNALLTLITTLENFYGDNKPFDKALGQLLEQAGSAITKGCGEITTLREKINTFKEIASTMPSWGASESEWAKSIGHIEEGGAAFFGVNAAVTASLTSGPILAVFFLACAFLSHLLARKQFSHAATQDTAATLLKNFDQTMLDFAGDIEDYHLERQIMAAQQGLSFFSAAPERTQQLTVSPPSTPQQQKQKGTLVYTPVSKISLDDDGDDESFQL